MKCALYIVNNTPPFSIMREIKTATDIDRIRPMDEPGRLSFRMSIAEGIVTDVGLMAGTASIDGSPIDPDEIREGSALIDWSSEKLDPWLWYVQTITFDNQSGMVDVECVEWRGLFFERQVPLDTPARQRSAPNLAKVLLQGANAHNPTYVTAHALSGVLRLLPQEPMQLGGLMLGDAFNEMAKRTASEWWLHYHIDWRFCEPALHWAYRRGVDRRHQVRLNEGVHLTAVSYSRDARDIPRLVRFITGGGITPGSSPSAAVVVGKTGETQMRNTSRGRFEPATEELRRRSLRAQHGPALQTEILEVLPQGADDFALLGAAFRRLQNPIVALQSIELTLRPPKPVFDVSGVGFLTPSNNWTRFDLGDTITVQLDSPHFLGGVDLDVRVVAIQPDEAVGEMVLVAEVQS